MDPTQQRPSHASYRPDGGPPPPPPLLYPLDPRPRSADYAPGPPAVPAVPPMGSAASPHAFDYAPSSSAHQHHHAHHHHQPQRSYINPLLPPGVDPSQVDFRTFHPYMPNEVKHRKRTSRAQFKVLEETFERFTKPNQELRKQLSAQLDMTPRAVQVWFQNRRAKEKNMKKKHQQGSRDKLSPAPEEGDEDSPSANGHTASSTDANGAGPSGDASPSSPSSPLTPGSSPTHAESASPRIPLIEQVPLPPSSAEPSPLTGTHPWPTADAAADPLLHLRRGSLPVGVGYGGGSHHDPHGRRRSIDTGLSRLARHPYASIARAANHSALSSRASFAAPSSAPNHLSPPYDAAGTYLHPGMHHQPHHYHHQPPAHYPYPPAHYAPGLHAHRPVLMHRASMPHALNVYGTLAGGFSHHRGSVDSSASPLATDVPVLAPPRSALSSRTRLLDASPLTISTRSVSSPIPGPLPSPTFVFGAAGGGMPAPAEEDEALHAELSTFAFPAPTSGGADGTSSSPSIPPGSAGSASSGSATGSNPPSAMGFDAHAHYAFDSRYGSIASVAESEASSAYFSDTSGACFDDPSAVSGERKASFATNGLFDMFGHLHVEAANLAPRELGPMEVAPTQQQQSTPPSVTTTGMAISGTYHSPDSASTVSPGASPASPPHGEDGGVRAAMAAPPVTLQISRESELTYALSPEQQGVVASAVVHTPPYNSTSASPHASAAYLAHPYATTTHVPSPPSAGVVVSGGGPYDTTGMYSDPSSSNSSSLNLPLSGVAGGHQGEFKSAEMSAFALGQPPQTAVSPVVDMSYGLMSFH